MNLREVNVAFRGSDRIASLLVDEGAGGDQGADFGYLHSDGLNLTAQQAKATIAAQDPIVAKLQASSRPEEIAPSIGTSYICRSCVSSIETGSREVTKIL